MCEKVKNLIKNSPLFPVVRPIGDWLIGPSSIESRYRQTSIEYGKKFNMNCLIETGTQFGHTVEAVKNNFNSIYSIELGEDLAKKAQERFKDSSYIKIIQGDSGEILPQLLGSISEDRILFWLDAHYSMGVTAMGRGGLTPIVNEIKNIFKSSKEFVILIDDARDFSWYNVVFRGRKDYPTIRVLKKLVKEINPSYKVLFLREL